MHKFAYGRIPPSINNRFDPLSINSRTENYKLFKYKFSIFDRFPTIILPKLWNKQKSEIKNTLSYNSVKNKLTDLFLSNYNDNIKCNFHDCPDCMS